MSALPKAVQKQINEANKIVKEVYGDDGKIADPAAAPAADPNAAPVVDPAAEPVADPNAAPAPAPAPVAAPAPDTDAEHKYKVLQGKYNKEVPRLQKALTRAEDTNRDLNQRTLNLESMIASMQALQEKPAKPKTPALPEITSDEREQFGDDLIDLIERVSKRATLPEIESHLKPLENRVTQVDRKVAHTETSVAESKRQQVFETLDVAVPEWRAQNENDDFLAWLDEEDALSGKVRGQLLTEAMNANDAQRVVTFFKGFQSENAAVPVTPTPVEEPKGEPAKSEPQVKLDELTAPGTPQTGTASAPNEAGKRVWSREDIAKFYADRGEFVKKGRPIPKELQVLERDLFLAQREGRLR